MKHHLDHEELITLYGGQLTYQEFIFEERASVSHVLIELR